MRYFFSIHSYIHIFVHIVYKEKCSRCLSLYTQCELVENYTFKTLFVEIDFSFTQVIRPSDSRLYLKR